MTCLFTYVKISRKRVKNLIIIYCYGFQLIWGKIQKLLSAMSQKHDRILNQKMQYFYIEYRHSFKSSLK